MNEVSGTESGTGLRAIKSSRSSDANFEYDDSEWDVGIGNLIIDLDADIEKNNEANRINNNSDISSLAAATSAGTTPGTLSGGVGTTPSSSNSNLSTNSSSSSSATTTGSSSPQMHIPLTSSSGSNSNNSSSNSGNTKGTKSSSGGGSGNSSSSNASSSLSKGSTNNSSSSSDISSVMEHSSVVDKGLKMKIKKTKTGTKNDATHEIVKNDVVGSSNGTSGGVGSSSARGGNSGYSTNKSISDSSKNSHSSHKDKDKLLIKDGLLHDNSHDNSSSINDATAGNTKQNNAADHPVGGGKVKTPRKGLTKEKKVKNNSNVGNSGNSKKDDKNNDSSKSLSNSGSGGNGSSSSSGTHAKDNKEFFSTTVNLNVPNVIPNSSSSAFVKATATIKVPTAPSSSASSLLSASSGGGGSGLQLHASAGGDSTTSTGNSRTSNLSTTNSSTGSSSNNSSSTPWGNVSPSKGGAEKGRLSPSVANLSNASDKPSGNSYNKKSRTFATSDKTGPTAEDNSASHGGPSSGPSSYRNQGAGALSINSATDLSTTSPNFIQGVPGTQSGSGFGSPKEPGKCGRTTATSTPSTQDVCVGTSVGTVTEPDCLGPCEPGTSVTLEGIVWHETESGVLVVNVTWRGKTYVGTLIDCTKNDWAPPRFCDSPTSDLEMRTPKNRGKRGRAQTTTPVNEPPVADTRSANAKLRNGAKGRRGSNTATAFVAPASPVKPDPWPKRKTRGSENESQEDANPKNAKRPKVSKDGDRKDRRSNSPAPDNEKSGPSSPQLIECPEPNCSKKYKHINGLRYHQSHAHSNNFVAAEDSDSNMSTASNTNASTAPEPSNSTDSAVEPMVVDNGPEVTDNGPVTTASSNPSTATNSSADDSLSAPSTPGKKSSGTIPQSTAAPKVDDKVYDLSADADLNSSKDLNSQTSETPEPYSKSGKGAMASKAQAQQGKDVNVNANDQEMKLTPENLSKDSTTPPLSIPTSTPPTTISTPTPTLIPRTPILTVPVVPYMSLQSRNLAHGHLVNVPRVETSLNSRENTENSPLKNSANQGSVPVSKGAPWQPHAHSQSGHSGHGSHVMNNPPQTQSITVPLNIPMNIPGSGGKDKDKNANPDQPPSKKNKHKKKSKDKDRERDGKSKGDKDKHDNNKSLTVPMGSGPSDYSRSSGLFHTGLASDSMGGRSKDLSGDDSEPSRKNSLENREDPQSPAYSDISDANDSGPDNELNVGGAIKDPTNCKGLIIPGELKKDPITVPGVPGPPFQSFFNHSLHSPYLDSLNYARQNKEGPGGVPEEPDKNRPGGGGPKHPTLPPNAQPTPPNPAMNPSDESRRSPKMDFHSKYPFPNYFSYPYSGHPYHYDHPPFGNPMAPENSFNAPGQNRMFPGMEDREREREKESGPQGLPGKSGKPAEKDDGPGNVQIKQEPVERDERRERKERERPPSSALPMNLGEDKHVEIKSEFGSDHGDPKLSMPSFMSNSTSKHSSKEHKRSSEDRHDRRHDSKDMDKSESIKSGRNSSSSSDKNKSMEESEPKERKDEGSKPTMETTGPPPPPTASAYYLPQSYLTGNPFGLPFDPSHPLYRQVLVPGHYPGSPYMHPGQIPRFPSPGGPTPLPEDLSRPSPTGPPGNPSKALDLLQHHAAQYYNSHKIHELQERALKSPSPQVAAAQRGERDGGPPSSGPGGPPTASSPGGHSMPGGIGHPVGGRSSAGGTSSSGSMPKPADLSKDAKPIIGPGGSIIPGGPNSDNGRTPPPTQHHVHSHTHHHTHVGIGYPILPTVPPQYSPHYGVLATPPSAPSVIPPFPSSQKPS